MTNEENQAWRTAMWDAISERYDRELDLRFRPAQEALLDRSGLGANQSVLDIGTGTGSVAIAASHAVGDGGDVTGIDVSDGMLRIADRRLIEETNIMFRKGSVEEIPAVDNAFDVVLASLVMMFVPDREAAAREIARVLKPGGRFVASVWGSPEECGLVKFQALAGSFAPEQPTPGIGPSALADPLPFQAQLLDAGVDTDVETEEFDIEFETFDLAWDTIATVTIGDLEPSGVAEAKRAVQDALWPNGEGPQTFRNVVRFIVENKG